MNDENDGVMESAPMDDDFDDFEQGQENTGDDDFGDFDNGFQAPQAVPEEQPPTVLPPPPLPLIDLDTIQNLPDLIQALDAPLDQLFPSAKEVASLPPVEPIREESTIFNTERSLSLWSQLVTPPPLQPQNWVKSRIRRLFLVSLGVPVDLDEILPASKQKKLVLPSITPAGGGEGGGPSATTGEERSRTEEGRDETEEGKKGANDNNDATATPASSASSSVHRQGSLRGGPAPAPSLDLLAIRRLCTTTDAALNGMTDEELKTHTQRLRGALQKARHVLEYWMKRRDALVSEKEAFEGVIENLVSHVRRVRK